MKKVQEEMPVVKKKLTKPAKEEITAKVEIVMDE